METKGKEERVKGLEISGSLLACNTLLDFLGQTVSSAL